MGKQVIKEGDHVTDIFGQRWLVTKGFTGMYIVTNQDHPEKCQSKYLEQFLIENNKDYRFIYE